MKLRVWKILWVVFTMSLTSCQTPLPDYVVINDPKCEKKEVLRNPAETVTFPLTPETKKIIEQLEAKFDQEENIAGLAAPQVGFNKRIIVFAVYDDPEIKKFRHDLTDTMDKSIWINPSYTALSKDKSLDWEGCFSVDEFAGQVPRYTEISYEAWTPEGKKVTGTARGFLARLLQHEIDHINGKLFIDYLSKDDLIPLKELRKRRGQE